MIANVFVNRWLTNDNYNTSFQVSEQLLVLFLPKNIKHNNNIFLFVTYYFLCIYGHERINEGVDWINYILADDFIAHFCAAIGEISHIAKNPEGYVDYFRVFRPEEGSE